MGVVDQSFAVTATSTVATLTSTKTLNVTPTPTATLTVTQSRRTSELTTMTETNYDIKKTVQTLFSDIGTPIVHAVVGVLVSAVSPAAGMSMQRTELINGLCVCDFDSTAELDPATSPTTLQIGRDNP